ncbi:hypothetical protein FHS91_002509 [Sphingobium xanthum]|uniref:restriction endonuclease n=1 Tax=Sphingobium xanthum TaxID=1387165 RepID=UPI001C8CA9BB|nr:restriction endonuclease [Sphingobium xanthum]
MISDDEYLERIVAGIHAVSSNDADVRWNEKINGRQFDVVVRFRLGTLSYLVVVEVKNRSRRASASDLEAFVTKARDQQANKAVFVTVAGFQEGALTVAKKHGVDLFTIEFDQEVAELSPTMSFVAMHNPHYVGDRVPRLSLSEPVLMQVVEHARLHYSDGQSFDVPDEASQMNYYTAKSTFEDGTSLGDLIQSAPFEPLAEGMSRKTSITLDPPSNISPPDEYFFPSGVLEKVDLTFFAEERRALTGNILIEPSTFASPVKYRNVLTGEETTYSRGDLPLNTEPLAVGGFYLQMHPVRFYHCDAVAEKLVTWSLIESFQSNQLIRSTYTQEKKYGVFYIPVSDRTIIGRLRSRLADYRELSAASPHASMKRRVTPLRKKARRPKALRGR